MTTSMMRTVMATAMALSAPAASFAAADGHGCTAETLRGRYLFSASGFTIVGGVPQPKAIIEVIDFGGDGTLTVAGGTKSVNGVVGQNLGGLYSYSLSEDCSGAIMFDGPAFDIFVAPNGDELRMIQTNPNSVFQGSATRVWRNPARDRDPR